MCRAITAMAALVRQGLLEKVTVQEMLRATAPFLLHSNLWVRQSTAGLVAVLASKLDPVEVQVEKPYLLLAALREPVPRGVLEQVLRHPDTPGLIAVLEERQTARRLCRGGGQVGARMF